MEIHIHLTKIVLLVRLEDEFDIFTICVNKTRIDFLLIIREWLRFQDNLELN